MRPDTESASAPLEHYALIGDLQSAALVGRDGSIDWLCLPRFDSPACLAALLDNERAGRWRIAPAAGGECVRRAYRADTLILETEFRTEHGHVRIIDFMPPRGSAPDVVRIVVGESGCVPMRMDLRPRMDYGRVRPWIRRVGAEVIATAGPDALSLSTPVHVQTEDGRSIAQFEVSAGDRVPFVLAHHPSHRVRSESVQAEEAMKATESFWREWMSSCTYTGPWAEAVRRSLITLKALTYAPTGGIVAAPTTSLPEQVGGRRNWDYRYCWLRDATMTLQALLAAGFRAEAAAWREWLLRAVAGDPADLQILYAVDGTRRIPEQSLDWLAGYADSRPVRTGNAAAGQFQLDVWGEVLVGLSLARAAGLDHDADAWAVQRELLEFLEGNWDRADAGLWEIRGPSRPFVHSKVLAWAGLGAGIAAVERSGLPGDADAWRAARDQLYGEICTYGYDADRNTFTQFYGSRGLDAALLLLPRVGFLPWTDPRMVGTVEAVERELCQDGLLRRYDTAADGGVDGLPGGEATFLICSFWLVDALHATGRPKQARSLFERLLDLRNDVGLLAEQYDVPLGRQLGNMPQAFSHIGVINSACLLSGSSTGRASDVASSVFDPVRSCVP